MYLWPYSQRRSGLKKDCYCMPPRFEKSARFWRYARNLISFVQLSNYLKLLVSYVISVPFKNASTVRVWYKYRCYHSLPRNVYRSGVPVEWIPSTNLHPAYHIPWYGSSQCLVSSNWYRCRYIANNQSDTIPVMQSVHSGRYLLYSYKDPHHESHTVVTNDIIDFEKKVVSARISQRFFSFCSASNFP